MSIRQRWIATTQADLVEKAVRGYCFSDCGWFLRGCSSAGYIPNKQTSRWKSTGLFALPTRAREFSINPRKLLFCIPDRPGEEKAAAGEDRESNSNHYKNFHRDHGCCSGGY